MGADEPVCLLHAKGPQAATLTLSDPWQSALEQSESIHANQRDGPEMIENWEAALSIYQMCASLCAVGKRTAANST